MGWTVVFLPTRGRQGRPVPVEAEGSLGRLLEEGTVVLNLLG